MGTAVVDERFKQFNLSDYSWTCDTFVCPTEVIAFSECVEEFSAVGGRGGHLLYRLPGGLGPTRIPLLSDITHQIAKDYGVYMEGLGHTLRQDTHTHTHTHTQPIPGLFIIDSVSILKHVTLNNLPVERSVDETLRLALALKHTTQVGPSAHTHYTGRASNPRATPTPSKSDTQQLTNQSDLVSRC
uniref:thioredoxin-dependent peroxiredoxin n=1 Tax=Hucho hucho TaxID=62062 RepID=A0A4W5JT57_9TELE